MKRIRWQSTLPAYLILIVIIFYFLHGWLKPGFPAGHDLLQHFTRAKGLDYALLEGQVPVRWVAWTFEGGGAPLFNTYPPGFYYLVSGVKAVTGSLSQAIYWVVLGSLLFGSWCLYRLARPFGLIPAITATILFISSPYLLVNAYDRAAYLEILGLSLSLALVLSLKHYLTSQSFGYLILICVLIGMLLITHPPTAIIISLPIIIMTSVYCWVNKIRMKLLGGLFTAGLLGIGLASFYLLPAFRELSLVHEIEITTGWYDFHNHFLPPVALLHLIDERGVKLLEADTVPLTVGSVHLVTVFLALLLIVSKWRVFRTQKNYFWQVLGYITLGLYSLGMTSPYSAFLWESLPFLGFMTFPWRFLMLLPIAISLLMALTLRLTIPKRHRLLVLTLLGVSLLTSYTGFNDSAERFSTDAFGINDPWDHTYPSPYTVDLETRHLPTTATFPIVAPDHLITSTASTSASILEKVVTHEVIFTVHSPIPHTLRIARYFFPGWTLYVDGKKDTSLSPDARGYMTFGLPSGNHHVRLALENTPIRNFANWISGGSVFILILISLIFLMRKSPKEMIYNPHRK